MTDATATDARVTAIYRYPVKGLTPEQMTSIAVTAGEPLPFDRAYAIENGTGKFDPLAPKHLPKVNFLMLMRDEKLAALDARFDDASHTLTIHRDGRQVVSGALNTPIGRSMIEQFFAGYMEGAARGAPKVVTAHGHTFSDVPAKCVHLVNLESVRALERAANQKIDPLRFRANIYIDGLPAWSEFDLLDTRVTFGEAEVQIWDRTVRCAATNVDPKTANRDMAVPNLLRRHFGHEDFGVYAKVTRDGKLSQGDIVKKAT